MRGQEHGDLVVGCYAVKECHDFLHAPRIEVRQGFVEKEQLWSTDQRMGYQYPLLFSSRECSDASISKAICIDVVDHLLYELALTLGAATEAVTLCVQAKSHKIPGPDRNIGIEQHLLRDVSEGAP